MTGYNGWTNYETWAAALWLDNDYGTYSMVRERIAELADPDQWPDGTNLNRDDRVFEMRDWLKEFVEEMAPDLGASLFADLLNTALLEVDWVELAEHYVDES